MVDGQPPRARLGAVAWLRRAVTQHIGYKAAALFFASVLWLVGRSEEPTEDLVPVQLDPAFDSMRTLEGTRTVVRVLVAGRARDLLKLYNEPPIIRRTIASNAPDTVRLELRPADVLIPAGIDAIVRDVQPRAVLLYFAVRDAKRVPVRSALDLALDSAAIGATPVIRPESVLVIGRRAAVARIERVHTLGGALLVRDTLPRAILLDTAGLGVRVEPAQVILRLVPGPAPRLSAERGKPNVRPRDRQ